MRTTIYSNQIKRKNTYQFVKKQKEEYEPKSVDIGFFIYSYVGTVVVYDRCGRNYLLIKSS